MAFEDANSKFLDVVSVADVDAEEKVVDRFLDVLKLRFCRDFEPRFWWWYWSWSLVKILKYIFGQDWGWVSVSYWSWSLVEILKQNFDQLLDWPKSSYFGESTQPLGLLWLWQSFLVILLLISSTDSDVISLVIYQSQPKLHWTIRYKALWKYICI